jgi:hypothetical protein
MKTQDIKFKIISVQLETMFFCNKSVKKVLYLFQAIEYKLVMNST